VTSWLFPATTARRASALPLPVAWAVHLVCVLLGATLIAFLITWAEAGFGGIAAAAAKLADVADALSHRVVEEPAVFAAGVLGAWAGIEAVHVAVAILLMAWGAKDEPMLASFCHSLRQTWLHTSHFLVGILLVGGVALFFERLDRQWQVVYARPVYPSLTPPTPPALAKTHPDYAKAGADYQTALAEHVRKATAAQAVWTEQWLQWRARRPWYLREPEPVIAATVMASLLWILAALLRGVGAGRVVVPVDRPPLCRKCGYNLLTIALEARCPECGEPVAASLGRHAQPGVPWEKRQYLGMWRAWWETALAAIAEPWDTGQRLKVAGAPTHHRGFLVCHLPFIGLIGSASLFGVAVYSMGLEEAKSEPLSTAFLPLMFGLLCVIGALGVVLFGAWAPGLGIGFRNQRNLMPASMQLACYLAPFLVLWEVIGAGVLIVAGLLEEDRWFTALERQTGVPAELALFLSAGLPNLVMGVLYFHLIHRGTIAARFANR
jgi:hypothetical protein